MKFLIVALSILTSSFAWANDLFVGGLIGPSFATNPNEIAPSFGIEFGWKPHPNFGISIYNALTFLSDQSTDSGDIQVQNSDFVELILAAKATYYVLGDKSGPIVSVIMGEAIVFHSVTYVQNGSDWTNDMDHAGFLYGPSIGYNYIINSQWSVDPQVNYLWTSATSLHSVNLMISGKFWF